MARFSRLDVYSTMLEVGVIPLFFNGDVDTALSVLGACSAGGARVVEFTNRGDFALDVFAPLEKECRRKYPEIILGIGSVVDPGTASLFMQNGANFVVGPVLNPEVAKVCNRRQVGYLPGCGSASEISTAQELGCEIVKVFPAGEVGGPKFLKGVRAPMPWSRLMPTGGVRPTKESLSDWFGAGAACVGMGSALITKDLVATGDFDSIAENIKGAISLADEIRKQK